MAKRKQLSLFVFVDAFGWEVLQRNRFLDDIAVTKQRLGTVLGYSSTCVPTILTGKMPQEHGHLSFFRYDPGNSPFSICTCLSALPKTLTERGRVRRGMSKLIQKFYGYDGYFQIYNMPFRHLALFDYSEKRDLYQPGGINNAVPTIFDTLRDEGIPFHVSDWRRSEAENLQRLGEDIDRGDMAFAYLYLAAMDGVLHANGTASPVVTQKIAWYDQALRDVMRKAERAYGDVRLFVFSDHGMTDTTSTVDLMRRIDALGLTFGVDYAAVYDSTMARFWFLRDSARERIRRALDDEPAGRILSDEELSHYGCDFAGREYGELFFLTNPGVLLCPSFMGVTPLAGMHGYAPEHADAWAMLASNVEPDPMPTRLDDMFRLMLSEAQRSHVAGTEVVA